MKTRAAIFREEAPEISDTDLDLDTVDPRQSKEEFKKAAEMVSELLTRAVEIGVEAGKGWGVEREMAEGIVYVLGNLQDQIKERYRTLPTAPNFDLNEALKNQNQYVPDPKPPVTGHKLWMGQSEQQRQVSSALQSLQQNKELQAREPLMKFSAKMANQKMEAEMNAKMKSTADLARAFAEKPVEQSMADQYEEKRLERQEAKAKSTRGLLGMLGSLVGT